MGVSAFARKHRLAKEAGSTYSVDREVADDVRRAICWVRAPSGDYGTDPARAGIMDLSARGELITLVADDPMPARRPVRDAIDQLSAHPDVQVLIVPGPAGQPTTDIAHASPAFIVAGSLDQCCAAPSVTLSEQLRRVLFGAKFHMYAGGDHAFNLDNSDRLSILHWPDRLADWLADNGWLGPQR